MQKELKQLVTRVPGVQTLWARHYDRTFQSPAGFGRFRGVFASFDEARASAPKSHSVGPDNADYAALHVDRVERIFFYDYPVLYWLRDLLGAGLSVFDWGGNVGIHYYGYQRYLDYPPGLSWLVCEVPALIAAGRKIAEQRGAPGLSFTENAADCAGSDVFLCAGALQYIETPLATLLASVARKPRHLFLNKLPLYSGEPFVTLQNAGVTFLPQHVFNRSAFIRALEHLGYELQDEWETPHLSCCLPFQPERSVPVYSGLYLKRGESVSGK